MITFLYLSFTYPLTIRYLSFCDPILYLSFLGFQLIILVKGSYPFAISCFFFIMMDNKILMINMHLITLKNLKNKI